MMLLGPRLQMRCAPNDHARPCIHARDHMGGAPMRAPHLDHGAPPPIKPGPIGRMPGPLADTGTQRLYILRVYMYTTGAYVPRSCPCMQHGIMQAGLTDGWDGGAAGTVWLAGRYASMPWWCMHAGWWLKALGRPDGLHVSLAPAATSGHTGLCP